MFKITCPKIVTRGKFKGKVCGKGIRDSSVNKYCAIHRQFTSEKKNQPRLLCSHKFTKGECSYCLVALYQKHNFDISYIMILREYMVYPEEYEADIEYWNGFLREKLDAIVKENRERMAREKKSMVGCVAPVFLNEYNTHLTTKN